MAIEERKDWSAEQLSQNQRITVIAGTPVPRPRWKDQMRVQSHDMSVTANWTGLPQCIPHYEEAAGPYQPLPGWGILEVDVHVRSSNNGGHSTAILAAGGSFIATADVDYAYSFAIDLAVKIGDVALEAKLRKEHSEHRRTVYEWHAKENTFFLKTWAKAHGDCLNQKRGWHECTGHAKLVYIGEPNGLSLLKNLLEDNGLAKVASSLLGRIDVSKL